MIMSNVSVIYATKTQHSRKIAEAIGRELGVKAINIANDPQLAEEELLFIVGGIYGGKCNPELLSYAEKLDASLVKKAVLVTSSASDSLRSQKELREFLMKKGIDVVDEIGCTGSILFVKAGHPNQADLRTVAKAAKNISEKVLA